MRSNPHLAECRKLFCTGGAMVLRSHMFSRGGKRVAGLFPQFSGRFDMLAPPKEHHVHLEDDEEGEEEEDHLEDEVIDPEAKRLRRDWKDAPVAAWSHHFHLGQRTWFGNGNSSNVMFGAHSSLLCGSTYHSEIVVGICPGGWRVPVVLMDMLGGWRWCSSDAVKSWLESWQQKVFNDGPTLSLEGLPFTWCRGSFTLSYRLGKPAGSYRGMGELPRPNPAMSLEWWFVRLWVTCTQGWWIDVNSARIRGLKQSPLNSVPFISVYYCIFYTWRIWAHPCSRCYMSPEPDIAGQCVGRCKSVCGGRCTSVSFSIFLWRLFVYNQWSFNDHVCLLCFMIRHDSLFCFSHEQIAIGFMVAWRRELHSCLLWEGRRGRVRGLGTWWKWVWNWVGYGFRVQYICIHIW